MTNIKEILFKLVYNKKLKSQQELEKKLKERGYEFGIIERKEDKR